MSTRKTQENDGLIPVTKPIMLFNEKINNKLDSIAMKEVGVDVLGKYKYKDDGKINDGLIRV